MITELKIENYKSIQDLTLDVGRVNVLIGENGCGKSNILEAITFAAAAAADKLNNEFLAPRGIRVTEPQLMRSVFNDKTLEDRIYISIGYEDLEDFERYILANGNYPYAEWTRFKIDEVSELVKQLETQIEILDVISARNKFRDEIESLEKILENYSTDSNIETKDIYSEIEIINLKIDEYNKKILELADELFGDKVDIPISHKVKNNEDKLKHFVIYSPENTALRNFEEESQIEPLGINGEGLFKLLTVIKNEAKQSKQESTELDDIQESLELFGWYESIVIPDDFSQLEKKITIKDRYLEIPFDQRSANEGFLLVLFYITLVVSKYTPKIFAIDNIDTSLNPKLCTKLIKELARLAKKYDKQLFVTSHNPAILDGIDLSDDEQRLFVVSRNKQGHTRCKRIDINDKPKSSVRDRLSKLFNDNETYTKEDILNKFDNSEEPLKLSYALLRGYLGGLPKNF
jgi:predicted ATPase